MDTQERKYTHELNANKAFFLEYGKFLTLWNMFEMRLEFLIWHIKSEVRQEKLCPLENCLRVNPMKTEQRKKIIKKLLKKEKQAGVLKALDKVFEIAERDIWVHGHLIAIGSNPQGLYRFKVEYNSEKNKLRAVRKFIPDFSTPFSNFKDAWLAFNRIAEEAFNLQSDAHDKYLTKVLNEQDTEDALQETSEST